ncbi:hypothetical protein KC323_g282 [Hortaea werneckii]|nr:hypothetical protein KC323_g282 [Hortaea werneckii]
MREDRLPVSYFLAHLLKTDPNTRIICVSDLLAHTSSRFFAAHHQIVHIKHDTVLPYLPCKVNQLLRGENKDAVIAGNPEVLESQSRHYYVHGLHDNIVNQCSEFSTNPFVEALD